MESARQEALDQLFRRPGWSWVLCVGAYKRAVDVKRLSYSTFVEAKSSWGEMFTAKTPRFVLFFFAHTTVPTPIFLYHSPPHLLLCLPIIRYPYHHDHLIRALSTYRRKTVL